MEVTKYILIRLEVVEIKRGTEMNKMYQDYEYYSLINGEEPCTKEQFFSTMRKYFKVKDKRYPGVIINESLA